MASMMGEGSKLIHWAVSHSLDGSYEDIGTYIIGFTVSTCLYGVTVLQTYLYFRAFPRDKYLLKALVILLFTLDTLATILTTHALWVFVVDNMLNLLANLNTPWSIRVDTGITMVVTSVVQCYFADRLWRLSASKILTGFIVFLSLGAFGLGIATTVNIVSHPSLDAIDSRRNLVSAGVIQAVVALCDILITGALCYYLHSRRSGVANTEKLVDKLVIYAINRGLLTSIAQFMWLVLELAFPSRTLWQPFFQIAGKLYVNSVLATLNVRTALRELHLEGSHISVTTNVAFKVGESQNSGERLPMSASQGGIGPQEVKLLHTTVSRSTLTNV